MKIYDCDGIEVEEAFITLVDGRVLIYRDAEVVVLDNKVVIIDGNNIFYLDINGVVTIEYVERDGREGSIWIGGE